MQNARMFVVKRLGKNGMWNAVSLIDENGSFRGEAKFETKKEAEEYMARYLKRMKNRFTLNPDGTSEGLKVFDESKDTDAHEKPKSKPDEKPKSTSKKKK